MPCVAWSLERTLALLKFEIALGTLREPPKRSQWRSCARLTSKGPPSHAMAPDHTCGRRTLLPEVSVSSVEYCTAPCKPTQVGDSYCTTFVRRRWKLDAELVPKPVLRSTLLDETKLPLETPRNEMSSP